jgi:hypothetical protein
MHRAYFDTTSEAVDHARKYGGWIAECEDGTVQWFCATRWTLTPILTEVNKNGGGTVGTWPLFDPEHGCHEFLTVAGR